MCCLSLLKVDFGGKKARSLLPPLCAGSGWFAGLAPYEGKGEHQGDEGLDMRHPRETDFRRENFCLHCNGRKPEVDLQGQLSWPLPTALPCGLHVGYSALLDAVASCFAICLSYLPLLVTPSSTFACAILNRPAISKPTASCPRSC